MTDSLKLEDLPIIKKLADAMVEVREIKVADSGSISMFHSEWELCVLAAQIRDNGEATCQMPLCVVSVKAFKSEFWANILAKSLRSTFTLALNHAYFQGVKAAAKVAPSIMRQYKEAQADSLMCPEDAEISGSIEEAVYRKPSQIVREP